MDRNLLVNTFSTHGKKIKYTKLDTIVPVILRGRSHQFLTVYTISQIIKGYPQ